MSQLKIVAALQILYPGFEFQVGLHPHTETMGTREAEFKILVQFRLRQLILTILDKIGLLFL